MDAVGNCPCNPSIGGTAKGHLVREIDALGGEMGKAAERCPLDTRALARELAPWRETFFVVINLYIRR